MAPPAPSSFLSGMARSHRLGVRGEEIAAEFLERRGYRILVRNFRLRRSEIDLVVRRGGTIAFVEVKTRRGLRFGHPLEALTWAKRIEIERTARGWIGENPDLARLRFRFDVVSILWRPGEAPRVEHVVDAWRAER